MKGTVVRILNPSKRSGTSDSGVDWNISEVEVKREDGSIVKADTFDTVVDGDIVELEPNNYTNPKTNKTYNGWNAKIPKAPRPGGGGGADNGAVLEAVRMVFREVKEVKTLLAEVQYGVRALMGPAEDVPETAAEEPAEGPARDWQSVGKDHDEPTVEPLPEEPEDLASFMNG